MGGQWEDGLSGLGALTETLNEVHNKAIMKNQLQNGEKKHCCQHIKNRELPYHGDEITATICKMCMINPLVIETATIIPTTGKW